jgi:hypothetical protein
MSKSLARLTLGSLTTLGLGVALAQDPTNSECEENGRGRHVQVCDVRELTFLATGSLSIVDRTNGDISVRAWDRDEVYVRALVRATARDLEVAREIAASVVVSEGETLRASGPEWRGNQSWAEWRGNESWTVDYDVRLPRETELTVSAVNGEVAIRELSGDISVNAVNGEVAISEVSGDISVEVVNGQIAINEASGAIAAETVNGNVKLEGVSGNVDGRAVNGRIEVTLVGDRLAPEGVDLATVNGPVSLRIPQSYSAQLELETVSGGINVDFPITISGRLPRRISTPLGGGGPIIRIETTAGAIHIDRY